MIRSTALVAMAAMLGVACGGGGSADSAAVEPESRRGAVEVTEAAQVDGELCSFLDRSCDEDDDPAVGTPAPAFRSVDPSGVPVEIVEGEPVVVVFVAHWCAFCQSDLPALLEAASTTSILLVSTAQDPSAGNWPPSRWLGEAGWEHPVVVDDLDVSIAHAFGVSALPYYVVIDADGDVVRRDSGSKSLDEVLTLARN